MSQFRRKLLESYATNKLVYPGLIAAWSAKGKTNEDADRNVLKDLTGNGHDITLNGFAFSEMSGYGGYILSIPEIKHDGDHVLYNNYMKFKIVSATIGKQGLIFRWNGQNKRTTFKLKVKYNKTNCKLYFGKAFSIGDDKTTSILLKDGINEIPYLTWSETEKNWEGIMAVDTDNSELPTNTTLDVDVEFLPEYPDALVFDGVDDYGVNENMPILEDFTLIINKNDIAIPEVKESFYISKSGSVGNGAFILGFSKNKKMYYSSYGTFDLYDYKKVPILYITPNSFNGSVFPKGNAPDTEILTIGTIRPNDHRAWKGAIYSAYLFDRSLDDQEIKSFIRKHIDPEYLLPSEIPNPDVYYDFTNGDNSKGEANNVITDLSGNGNDATAHNFAWNEESGYAEGGGLKFDGVDDYITLNNTNNTKVYYRTVIGVVTVYKNKSTMLYDQRKFNIQTHNGALFYEGILYYSRNNINAKNCLTYINGELNKINVHSNNTVNKLHNFAVTFDDAEFDNIREQFITIGSTNGYGFNTNMNMYKFMAFKDRLTEEQIKAVINKYNLLDGVDNIDVN